MCRQLQAAVVFAAAAVAHVSQLPPPSQCVAEFERLCCDAVAPLSSCSVCAGQHQQQLRAADCRAEDVMRLCPAVVVLDECADSFALYYLDSDSTAERTAVAMYERTSGNLTLATCLVGGAPDACRTRSDWKKAHLRTMYDNYVSAVGVAVLPGGGVFVVWVAGFPAKVAGVLCADGRCLSPTPIDVYDSWNGAGDSVSVAASDTVVAVVFATGFQNKGGIALASVTTSQLGKTPLKIQQLYAGEVAGPVSVAVSGPRVSTAFMGARCQNVSVSTCANVNSSCAAMTTLTVATDLQKADPTSFTVLTPSLALREKSEPPLLVWPSQVGSGFLGGGRLHVAQLGDGGAAVTSSANVANGSTKGSIASTGREDGGAVLAFSTDYHPGPPYTSLRAGECDGASCSSLRGVRVVESGVLDSDLTLSVVPGSGDGTRVLSFSSSCRSNNQSSPGLITCVKVALWDAS